MNDINNPLEDIKVKSALRSEEMKLNYRKANKPEDINILDYTIIAALEKQIPKKPIENFYDERDGEDWYDEGNVYNCPCCDNLVGQYSTESEQWIWEINNYCPNCGQKINNIYYA